MLEKLKEKISALINKEEQLNEENIILQKENKTLCQQLAECEKKRNSALEKTNALIKKISSLNP